MGLEKGGEISLRYSVRDARNSKVDEMGEYAVHDHEPSWVLRSGDHFEFITSAEIQSELCPADDIFVSGKLLPLNPQCDHHTFPIMQLDDSPIAHRPRKDVHRKRSESTSELNPTFASSSIKRQVVRNYSCKTDGSSVSSNSSIEPDPDRNSSWKSGGTSFGSPKISWHSLISGMWMVKIPLEMELRDIKYRQSRRRRPASVFPATSDSAGGGRGTTWGLIKALSCKDHTSTSVNTPFVYMPHITFTIGLLISVKT